MKVLSAMVVAGALLLGPNSAWAVSFGFGCITNNDPASCAIGEAQIMMDVDDIGGGQVKFTFTNVGPDASTLARIYFDDGALSELATIIDNPPDVDFEQKFPGPSNLPGHNLASPPFVATKEFNTGATDNPPLSGVGIDVGENVMLIFDLELGMDFADLLADLDNGDLRVGVHVINFANGESESLINDGGNGAPEPASMLMLGLGLGAMALLRRRRA